MPASRSFWILAHLLAPTTAFSAAAITTLHSFSGDDGQTPVGQLVEGSDGRFYGVTKTGGDGDCGTIFSISPSGDHQLLHSLQGATDGCEPESGLVRGPGDDEIFYGVASAGGGSNVGTAYRITPNGDFETIHHFVFPGTTPRAPIGRLLLGDDDHFYGTSTGPLPGGKIFRLSTAGEVTVIHDFTGGAGGASPRIGLTRGPDGNYYGTTLFGGTGGITTSNGIIYSVTPDGGFTVLHDITEGQSGPADGPMVLGPDDNLYGATGLGGPIALGMAYRITPDGDFTPFFNFAFDGVSVVGSPSGGLVLAGDGQIYGVAGTFFRMTTDGEITRLTDNLVPGGVGAAIMQGSDGDFYGTSPGLLGTGIPAGAIFKVSGTAAPAGGGGGGAAATGGGGGGSLGAATLVLLASLLAVRRRNGRQP